jgi:hypothetical protein
MAWQQRQTLSLQQPILISPNLTEGIFNMAITPEIKPRVTVSADSEFDLAPRGFATTKSRQDRLESTSNNGIFMGLGVLALIVVGYLAYHYYYAPTSALPTITNQTTTPVEPPVVPATPPATTTTP